MSKQEVMVTEAVGDNTDIKAVIVKDGDDLKIRDIVTGELSGPLMITKDGLTYVLPVNAANRKWANIKKVDEAIATTGEYPLAYKATRTIGGMTKHAPYEKWLPFLTEEEQEEVKTIWANAVARKAVAKPEPKSEIEKLQDKIAKLQAKIAGLSDVKNN